MKQFLPAVSVAVIASTSTSMSVARGFNFAKYLARSRRLQASSLTPVASFHRAATCYIGPDGASTSTALSSAPPAKKSTMATSSLDSADDEIEQTARNSLGITGPLSAPANFGGIPYTDTSSLTSNQVHRVVFVLGGPGAGKGTQSERIVETYKCVHLSVGDLLRTGAEKADYPHADQVKECLVQGNIVPVALSLGLLRIAMDEKAEEENSEYGSRIFLVDGFPRNHDNVKGWMKHMPSYTAVLGVLVYNCPIEVLEQRIMARAETSGRSDDNLESAKRRFDTFQMQTEPVVRALQRVENLQAEKNVVGSQLRIVNIDATGTVDEVWKVTEAAMDAYVKNDVLTANENLLKAIEKGDMEKFEDLCDGKLEVDPIYEGPSESTISNAEVHIQNGTTAVVSYVRKIKNNSVVRETREWNHGTKGWTCGSVVREDLS